MDICCIIDFSASFTKICSKDWGLLCPKDPPGPDPGGDDINKTDMFLSSWGKTWGKEKMGMFGNSRRQGSGMVSSWKARWSQIIQGLEAKVMRFYFKCSGSLLENNMVWFYILKSPWFLCAWWMDYCGEAGVQEGRKTSQETSTVVQVRDDAGPDKVQHWMKSQYILYINVLLRSNLWKISPL